MFCRPSVFLIRRLVFLWFQRFSCHLCVQIFSLRNSEVPGYVFDGIAQTKAKQTKAKLEEVRMLLGGFERNFTET